MSGKAAEHRDAASAARQEHDASNYGLDVEHFRLTIAVKFRGDVEIMDTIADTGFHHHFGGPDERTRAVEENADVVQ